jgi:hypothetical protein
MDLLNEAIRQLYKEKESLDKVIASLEELQKSTMAGSSVTARGRRGQKSMSPDERLEVSERMKRHWAKQRRSVDSLPDS